jgi:anti-sigma-K factor RskA
MDDQTQPDPADATNASAIADLSPDLSPELAAALADEQTWAEVPDGVEDWLVAAIAAEATTVTHLDSRRRWRSIGLAAAAVAAVVAGLFAVVDLNPSDGGADVELALAATELAPGASADAAIDTTPLGTRILLDLRDLPPAPAGTYYEAWLRVDADIGVSAGTFHMRGGDGEIELWAGVSIDDYPLFTVTLQDEGGGAASSGRVVLSARFEP